MTIQEEIKELRTRRGLSREKLAKLANTTTMTVYRAEKTGRITLNNYLKITKTLRDENNFNRSSL